MLQTADVDKKALAPVDEITSWQHDHPDGNGGDAEAPFRPLQLTSAKLCQLRGQWPRNINARGIVGAIAGRRSKLSGWNQEHAASG